MVLYLLIVVAGASLVWAVSEPFMRYWRRRTTGRRVGSRFEN